VEGIHSLNLQFHHGDEVTQRAVDSIHHPTPSSRVSDDGKKT